MQDEEYSRQGVYVLSLPASDRGPWHICLYSVVLFDGERIVSPGLEPSARIVLPGPHPEVIVSYHLRRPRLPGRPWSLTFRTEPPGESIPPMALVVHSRTVPLSVHDGKIVDRFPASRDGATFRIRSQVNLSLQRARVFADPLAAPDEQPPIRLRHPEMGGTRV